MKFLAIFVAIIFSTSIHAEKSLPFAKPDLVASSFHTGYFPLGFDTNDRVQIVGEGIFINGCYRPAHYRVNIDHSAKVIELFPQAYFYNGFCVQVLVPYSQTIDLGILKTGRYEVVQGENRNLLGQIQVKTATSRNPDDYLYAPVQQAYLDNDISGPIVTISGNFTNSCLRMKEVRVNVNDNVIVVQPISEIFSNKDCRTGSFAYEESVELGSDVEPGRYLLHIRSLNGKAVNNLVDVK